MAELENLLAVALAYFVVTVSPGPANIAVATISMSNGRRVGILFGVGLSVGLAFWGLVAATGLGAVLSASADVLFVLKLLGGMYLLWLAWQSGRSAFKPTHMSAPTCSDGRWFWRGLMLNLSNPKAVVAWIAALSMGLTGSADAGFLIVTTALCMFLGVLNYVGHALAFSLSGLVRAYKNARHYVDGCVAGLFAIAGFSLIRSAFSKS